MTLVLLLTSGGQTAASPTHQESPLRFAEPLDAIVADLESLIPRYLREENVLGLSIALTHDDRVAWTEGFGIASSISVDPRRGSGTSVSRPHTGCRCCEGGKMDGRSMRVIVALVLGIAIGAAATWGLFTLRGTQVQIVEGYTTNVDQAGTGIGLASERDGPGKGYSIAGAWWREEGGPWNTTGPTCLEPLTGGQHIRIGVVQVQPKTEALGRELVLWLECLG